MSELFSLTGKVAAITGCTKGIGFGMTMALAQAGADICLLQRDVENTQVQKKVQELGRKCEIVYCDVSLHSSLQDCLERVLKVFPKVDILVNNAGIQKRHKAEEFPDEDWDLVIQANLKSVFTLSKTFGKYMIENKIKGKIVNTASLMSFQGGILVPAYAAAKGGVAQVTKAFANEFAQHGINVNAIAPGYISTDLTQALENDPVRGKDIMARIPAQRWGKPEDLGGPVVFLASRASDYIHGEILLVDGGWMGR
ncbi:putative 2-deoxy-D-gluconate 3-dehydrogenase [Backusella circina FSU 941]|nr:putative 2-deoxy-D-gluconate 3-dehydrogenase [Backusella circina FSU 941]